MNIVELERTRLRAIVEVDRRVLEDLHHADFVLCTPSGDLWDRQTYLSGLYDRSIDYARFEPQSEIQVQASESVAVVRYLSEIDIATSGGGGHLECWHLDVYVRDDEGTWRCKWSQATDTIRDQLVSYDDAGPAGDFTVMPRPARDLGRRLHAYAERRAVELLTLSKRPVPARGRMSQRVSSVVRASVLPCSTNNRYSSAGRCCCVRCARTTTSRCA